MGTKLARKCNSFNLLCSSWCKIQSQLTQRSRDKVWLNSVVFTLIFLVFLVEEHLSTLFCLGTVCFVSMVVCSMLLPEYQILVIRSQVLFCSLDFGCLYFRSKKGWQENQLVHAWARILIYQSSYNPLFSSVLILSLSFDIAEDGKGNKTSFSPQLHCALLLSNKHHLAAGDLILVNVRAPGIMSQCSLGEL